MPAGLAAIGLYRTVDLNTARGPWDFENLNNSLIINHLEKWLLCDLVRLDQEKALLCRWRVTYLSREHQAYPWSLSEALTLSA